MPNWTNWKSVFVTNHCQHPPMKTWYPWNLYMINQSNRVNSSFYCCKSKWITRVTQKIENFFDSFATKPNLPKIKASLALSWRSISFIEPVISIANVTLFEFLSLFVKFEVTSEDLEFIWWVCLELYNVMGCCFDCENIKWYFTNFRIQNSVLFIYEFWKFYLNLTSLQSNWYKNLEYIKDFSLMDPREAHQLQIWKYLFWMDGDPPQIIRQCHPRHFSNLCQFHQFQKILLFSPYCHFLNFQTLLLLSPSWISLDFGSLRWSFSIPTS